jgi:hypothetical protein
VQDRPTSGEVLATVAAYLEDELMPSLDGPLAYRTRVAANLLRILEREAAQGDVALARERELIASLLGADAHEAGAGALAEQVLDLNRRLAAAIDAGRIDHARAWLALMEIARAKLAIIRPGYDAWTAEVELP